MNQTPLQTALNYYRAWTSGDYDAAADLIADGVKIEVPVNHYNGKADFAQALRAFGGAATGVRLLGSLAGEQGDACLIYDMDVPGLGTLRVAEHFWVEEGRLAGIRQIHDTATVRKAGFAPAL